MQDGLEQKLAFVVKLVFFGQDKINLAISRNMIFKIWHFIFYSNYWLCIPVLANASYLILTLRRDFKKWTTRETAFSFSYFKTLLIHTWY